MRNYENTRLARLVLIALLSLFSAAACGDNTSFEDEDHVRTWANTASAVGVFAQVHLPLSLADGVATFADSACPTVSDDGVTMEIVGGCNESDGLEWVGRAVIVREGGDRTLTLEDFARVDNPEFRATLSGSATVTEVDATTHDFVLALEHRGVITTTYDYAGRVEGDYGAPTTWNGGGTVHRDGFGAPTGTVSSATTDQVLDDSVCSSQALSGVTEIEASDGRRVTIHYDGAEDCDEAQAARWALDGVDRGPITGVSCAVSRPGLGGGAPLSAVAFAGLLAIFVGGRLRCRSR